MKVVVIDYGMSNLGSVSHALIECGGEGITLSDNPSELQSATHIILPGVGSFRDGMVNLKRYKWVGPLKKAVQKDKVPLLGICLGMQLLSSKGVEGGETEGLNFISGTVEKLQTSDQNERIPHIGWNEVYPIQNNALFENICPGTDFYFVHSYHFIVDNKDDVLSTTPYCKKFVSSVCSDNVFGTQFHPEKSQRPGFQLLSNFLNF